MIGLDSYSRQVFNYFDPILIYISIWIDCLFEIRKIAICFFWLSLPSHYRVTDEALLGRMTHFLSFFIALNGSHFYSFICSGGLVKSTLSSFRHSDRFDVMFSLRCIDWVRKPLCEPNCLWIFFVFRIISGPRVTVVQWKAFKLLATRPHPHHR